MDTMTDAGIAVWPMAKEVEEPLPFRRIAIFRALFLGDLLLAVPAFRALRAAFREAEMTLIGLPWAAEFARRFGQYIDRFVAFGGFPGIAEVEVVPERVARFLAEQRAYGYDLVIQMHGSGRTSNPCVAALGGRMTVGYYDGEPPRELTLGAPYPDDRHEIYRNLGLTRLLGCRHRSLELEFPLFEADRAEAAALLRRVPGSATRHGGDYPLIGLHPGAKPPSRRWPPEYFARVADHFATRHGARVVLTGGPGDEETARAVASHMTTRPISVAGETSLGGLGALIDEMDLFISNDTGPAHIATALDVPSITIFGPVAPQRWAPLDRARHPIAWRPVECSPCSYWTCPIDHRCLRWIDPHAIVELGERLLFTGSATCNASRS